VYVQKEATSVRTNRNALLVPSICLLTLLLLIGSCAALAAEVAVTETTTQVQVGRDIVIPADTVAAGDVVAVLGSIDILGEVHGNAVAVGGSISVNGPVKGDVVSVGGMVRLGADAVVDGEVTAIGGGVDRNRAARVSGTINSIGIGEVFRHPRLRLNLGRWRWWSPYAAVSYLLYVLGLYALALLVIALVPSHVASVSRAIEIEWRRALFLGLMALLLIGPVTIVVAITIIGIPLALLIWLGFILAKILGYAAFVSYLGSRIAGSERNLHRLAQLAIGVAVLALVRYVPLLGPVASFFVTLVTLGAVLDTRFGTNRPWLPPRETE
jgi:hypothetical protein